MMCQFQWWWSVTTFGWSAVKLPQLRSSMEVDRSKPLPTSLQSDFIPDDVLFALTQPPMARDKLGPPTRTRNLSTSMVTCPSSVLGSVTSVCSLSLFLPLPLSVSLSLYLSLWMMYGMCSSGTVSTLCFVCTFSCIMFHSLIHAYMYINNACNLISVHQ